MERRLVLLDKTLDVSPSEEAKRDGERLMGLKILVLDCDGVILDSVGVKVQAFAAVGAQFPPEVSEWLVQAHREAPGISRHVLFDRLYRTWHGRDILESERQKLNKIFRNASRERLLHVPAIPGALETVRHWKGRIPIYVCSGAPQEDLRELFNARGLTELFTAVYGSPPVKTELLADIVREAGVLPEEALMVGDSSTDLEAARAVGTQFYGIGQKMLSLVSEGGMDLCGLSQWLEERVSLSD